MKRIVLMFMLSWLVGNLYAQQTPHLFALVGKDKAHIKQQLAQLKLIRDWGEGKSIDFEDARGANIKFKFDAQRLCNGFSLLSFKDETQRMDGELKAMLQTGWQLKQVWKNGSVTSYRFAKGNQKLNASTTNKQMFLVGRPTSEFRWRRSPAQLNNNLLAAEKKRISSSVNNAPTKTTAIVGKPEAMATIVKLKGDQLTVYTPNIPSSLKVGTKGNISRFYKKKLGNTSMSYWLVIGKGRVTNIQGQVITLSISDRMKMTINGKTKNFFVKGQEVKFAWGE